MKLAVCIIKNKEGKILLMHRNSSRKTHWEIPGGKIDDGEEPADAAVREIAEELGVTVRIARLIDTATFEEDGGHFDFSWFEAEITEGEPQLAETRTFKSHGYIFDGLDYFSLKEMHQMFDDLSANAQNFVLQSLQA